MEQERERVKSHLESLAKKGARLKFTHFFADPADFSSGIIASLEKQDSALYIAPAFDSKTTLLGVTCGDSNFICDYNGQDLVLLDGLMEYHIRPTLKPHMPNPPKQPQTFNYEEAKELGLFE